MNKLFNQKILCLVIFFEYLGIEKPIRSKRTRQLPFLLFFYLYFFLYFYSWSFKCIYSIIHRILTVTNPNFTGQSSNNVKSDFHIININNLLNDI